MSEDLQDEISAINSIYEPDTLTISSSEPNTYVLNLPEESLSIRIVFPTDYPSVPPRVIGTESSLGLKHGSAARGLLLFRQSLDAVFLSGQVCLFDAIEELKRLHVDEEGEEGTNGDAGDGDTAPSLNDHKHNHHDALGNTPPSLEDINQHQSDDQINSFPPPIWILSAPLTENKSTFLARTIAITSPAHAHACLAHLLATDRKVRDATHNITAWRIRHPSTTTPPPLLRSHSSSTETSKLAAAGEPREVIYQDYDDDGETAAGGRLLHLMQLMDVWNVMVVVTRWYGGQKLGPRRFAVINGVARDALVRGGFTGGEVDEGKGGRRGKK